MTDNTTETTAPKSKIYIVNPMFGEVKTADYIADAEKPGLKEILEMVRDGDCDTFTLPSGDRLVAGKGSIGMTGEAARIGAKAVGKFGFMKEILDFEKHPELLRSFGASETDLIMEVCGPAMIVGPVVSDSDTSVTSTTLTDLDVSKLVAWDNATRARMLVMSAITAAAEGKAAANDNAQWDDSVFREELVEHRMTLTDEELAACPCPGCKDELARRAVAAGGSAAVN